MSHFVKCSICGGIFDRDVVEFEKTSSRRYAHASCVKKDEQNKTEEDLCREKIFSYTKELFKEHFNYMRIDTQMKKLIKEKNYSYSGILKTLIYWYQVKNGDVSKSFYGLGIVPYVYKDAYDYYYNIWMAQQVNAEKNIEFLQPKEKKVIIHNPIKKPKRKHSSMFFFDEEGDNIGSI